MSDTLLRQRLIRLAHSHPEFREALLPLVREAKDFDVESIAAPIPGGSAEGVSGKADDGGTTISDADKPWMQNKFTNQESTEMLDDQESGRFSDGKTDGPMKFASASEAEIRARLIRLAYSQPDKRKDILELLK